MMRGRRPRRRDLAARRRQGQPDRPHPGAGQGRPAARCPGRRADPGHRRARPSDGASPACAPTRGDVEAEVVVNCAGQWATAVGAMAGVTVPLHSAEHFYVVTEPIEGVHPDLPVLRDPDGYTYFKEEVGGLVVGGFEPEAKPWVSPHEMPYPFEFQLLEEDWEHFSVLMDSALHRIPALQRDRDPQVLQRPRELHPRQPVHPRRGAGACAASSSAPASTRSASRPPAAPDGRWPSGSSRASRPRDLTAVDIRRFAPFNGNVALAARPGRRGARPALRRAVAQPRAARPPGRSAARRCTTGTSTRNAGFGSRMGWERPNFFAPAGRDPDDRVRLGQAELAAVVGRRAGAAPATAVTVFDQTSFSKYVVAGRDAEAGAAVGVHRRRRRAGRAHRLHRPAQRAAAPTSPT